MCEYQGSDKCSLQFLERFPAVLGEISWDIFPGEPREQDCDFRVAINETAIEIGKPKERHYILDFPGFGPALDGLDFVLGHREAIGDSIYPKYLHELQWNSHLSAQE